MSKPIKNIHYINFYVLQNQIETKVKPKLDILTKDLTTLLLKLKNETKILSNNKTKISQAYQTLERQLKSINNIDINVPNS